MFRTVARGFTLELHFSVAGYGGLRLPFRGKTEYLRGLVSVYERPIIAGVRVLIVCSIEEGFKTPYFVHVQSYIFVVGLSGGNYKFMHSFYVYLSQLCAWKNILVNIIHGC